MAYQFNEWQEKWLQALESGEYKQANGYLHLDGGYCCLGVGAVVCEIDADDLRCDSTLEGWPTVVEKLKLASDVGSLAGADRPKSSLAAVNDELEWDFKQIAAFIRANPEKVFTDAV